MPIQVVSMNNSFGWSSITMEPMNSWSSSMKATVPLLEEVLSTGKNQFKNDTPLLVQREGDIEECYFSFTLSPIFEEDKTVGGVFVTARETTQQVLAARRLKTLSELGNQAFRAKSLESACHLITSTLIDNNEDITFTLFYIIDDHPDVHGKVARLAATTFDEGIKTVKNDGNAIEELVFVEGESKRELPDFLLETFNVIKITKTVETEMNCNASGVREASPTSDTNYFKPSSWPINKVARSKSHLVVTLNNGARAILLPEYMAFLQFSHINTGELEPRFREDDIVKCTLELASTFKSLAKLLKLDYFIEIPSHDELYGKLKSKVFIDKGIYEKILLNLFSNAFNHTRTGSVTVRLYPDHQDEREAIILEVSYTGTRIPENDISNLFQRLYRVKSSHSRNYEGAGGIGLALIKELVTKHYGEIFVQSDVKKGTTFRLLFPTGWEHLPRKQIHFTSDNEFDVNRDFYIEELERLTQTDSDHSADIASINNDTDTISS
ncbi:11770_t:CDS:2, partial [Acaulospora colombiana]